MTSLTLFFLLLKKHSNCQSWLCTFPYSNFSWHIEHNKFWLLVSPRQPSFLTVTALTLPSAPPLLLPITLVLKNVLHVAWRLIAYRHWVSVIAVTDCCSLDQWGGEEEYGQLAMSKQGGVFFSSKMCSQAESCICTAQRIAVGRFLLHFSQQFLLHTRMLWALMDFLTAQFS